MTERTLLRDLDYFESLTRRSKHFHFYGLNELDVFENTPLGTQLAGGRSTGGWPGAAESPEMDRVYRRWLRVRSRSSSRRCACCRQLARPSLRRALCLWQIESLRRLVTEGDRVDAAYLVQLHVSLCRWLVGELGSAAALAYLDRRSDVCAGAGGRALL